MIVPDGALAVASGWTRDRLRGISLIEMVAALAIMGVAMAALLEARQSSLRQTIYAKNLSVAQELIRGKLSEIVVEELEEGTFPDDTIELEGYALEMTVTALEFVATLPEDEEAEEEPDSVPYFEVTVSATFPVMGAFQTVDVTAYYDVPLVDEEETADETD